MLSPRNALAVALALSVVAALVAAGSPIYDPDVWWVAAAGRELLQGGGVLRENRFSFTEPLYPWVQHEWLLGAAYGAGLSAFGPPFFVGVAVLVLSCSVGLVAHAVVGRARNIGPALALFAIVLLCFGSRWLSARPSGVASVFAVVMCLLAFARPVTRAHLLATVLSA